MKKLILVPKFIDRSGRTVYDMHEEKEGRYLMPGKFMGQMRIPTDDSVGSDIVFEATAESGVQGDGSG